MKPSRKTTKTKQTNKKQQSHPLATPSGHSTVTVYISLTAKKAPSLCFGVGLCVLRPSSSCSTHQASSRASCSACDRKEDVAVIGNRIPQTPLPYLERLNSAHLTHTGRRVSTQKIHRESHLGLSTRGSFIWGRFLGGLFVSLCPRDPVRDFLLLLLHRHCVAYGMCLGGGVTCRLHRTAKGLIRRTGSWARGPGSAWSAMNSPT